jgi:hypothetical protein
MHELLPMTFFLMRTLGIFDFAFHALLLYVSGS